MSPTAMVVPIQSAIQRSYDECWAAPIQRAFCCDPLTGEVDHNGSAFGESIQDVMVQLMFELPLQSMCDLEPFFGDDDQASQYSKIAGGILLFRFGNQDYLRKFCSNIPLDFRIELTKPLQEVAELIREFHKVRTLYGSDEAVKHVRQPLVDAQESVVIIMKCLIAVEFGQRLRSINRSVRKRNSQFLQHQLLNTDAFQAKVGRFLGGKVADGSEFIEQVSMKDYVNRGARTIREELRCLTEESKTLFQRKLWQRRKRVFREWLRLRKTQCGSAIEVIACKINLSKKIVTDDLQGVHKIWRKFAPESVTTHFQSGTYSPDLSGYIAEIDYWRDADPENAAARLLQLRYSPNNGLPEPLSDRLAKIADDEFPEVGSALTRLALIRSALKRAKRRFNKRACCKINWFELERWRINKMKKLT